jgi:hypothetical protein
MTAPKNNQQFLMMTFCNKKVSLAKYTNCSASHCDCKGRKLKSEFYLVIAACHKHKWQTFANTLY